MCLTGLAPRVCRVADLITQLGLHNTNVEIHFCFWNTSSTNDLTQVIANNFEIKTGKIIKPYLNPADLPQTFYTFPETKPARVYSMFTSRALLQESIVSFEKCDTWIVTRPDVTLEQSFDLKMTLANKDDWDIAVPTSGNCRSGVTDLFAICSPRIASQFLSLASSLPALLINPDGETTASSLDEWWREICARRVNRAKSYTVPMHPESLMRAWIDANNWRVRWLNQDIVLHRVGSVSRIGRQPQSGSNSRRRAMIEMDKNQVDWSVSGNFPV